ncbi:MAG TPA: FtsX-like permease family protein [Candidatus Desulfaltia sp.]|nr:FtsX-like permease family protein [Candidatus Desulfaltia sp.]
MLTLKMAFRNILRQKRRTMFTGLSIVGGFTLAVIFIGWADGSYNNIIDQFTRNRLGHIQIHEKTYLDRPSLYKTIDAGQRIGTILEQADAVESWAPRVYGAGLAAFGEKSAGVQIIGLDPQRENATTHFDRKIVQGRSFSALRAGEVVLGKGLAEILQTKTGDRVVLVSQAADGSIAQDLYLLVGIVATGDDLSDRMSFFLPLGTAQDYLVLGDRLHEIAVVVDRLSRVNMIAATLSGLIADPALSVDPWQVFARSFYEAMRADKAGMWVMLVIIVVIVAVGVLNTVLMSVLERRREYGLLKAVGTKPRQIVRLVLLEIMVLSLIAMTVGAGLGLGANAILSKHGVKFSSGLTYGGMVFDTMKSEINLRSFVIPAFTVLISAVLVSLFPAVKAARTEAAKTMRMH